MVTILPIHTDTSNRLTDKVTVTTKILPTTKAQEAITEDTAVRTTKSAAGLTEDMSTLARETKRTGN